jgi:hypothetical protein
LVEVKIVVLVDYELQVVEVNERQVVVVEVLVFKVVSSHIEDSSGWVSACLIAKQKGSAIASPRAHIPNIN